MLDSKSLPALLETTRQCIKLVLGASRVDFLLIDKNFVRLLNTQGGETYQVWHAHCRFEVAAEDAEPLKMVFKQMSEVVKKFYCTQKALVWPLQAGSGKEQVTKALI